jgi:hypothetical protein
MVQNRVNLYAIYGTSHEWEDEPFDESKLPAAIIPTVRIENVSSMFTPDAFRVFEERLSPDDLKSLKAVKFAIVHRFQTTSYHDKETQSLETGQIVYNVAACLRLIRPMRQFAMRVHGTLNNDGTLDVGGFDHPVHLMEVPAIQKDFRLRNRDIEELQKVAAKYESALTGEYWKFRMPLNLHDAAHFIDDQWKARMSLMCSAIEAIYTSQTHDREHSGSKVAKARIKWFLGENTSIYAPGDVPSFYLSGAKQPTIADVLDDLYEVRNCIAHGDRVPDKHFNQNGSVGISVLEEAASYIVRASLIKMLKEDLLVHFKGGPESQAYFSSHGLIRSRLPKI